MGSERQLVVDNELDCAFVAAIVARVVARAIVKFS